MLGSLLVGHFYGRQNYRAMIITTAVIVSILLICIIKRRALTDFLDRVELKDGELQEETDG